MAFSKTWVSSRLREWDERGDFVLVEKNKRRYKCDQIQLDKSIDLKDVLAG